MKYLSGLWPRKYKKSLGQNFLVDKNLQRKIAAGCSFKDTDTVLEIGPGRGALTRIIADKVKLLYAVEIDKDLCRHLEEEFKNSPNIKIIHHDILKLELPGYFIKPKEKIKVVGNIPYYISTPIIERLLKYRQNIEEAFLTLQKEFAKRIVAKPGSGDYGSLSCFVQYYAQAQILFTIKKNSFFPVPKVDSCFLRLNMKDKLPLGPEKEKEFFRVVRAAFNQRRKILRNSLQGVIPQSRLDHLFSKYNINKNTRPEELSQSDFINLINSQENTL
ncbi:MAG: ribosomal RNA small subunit methyltransferase A [Candidatus Omnitrophica bacterium]|nr:ribosomal RNA small subunit methyltransferase A [Candidatus Omnitrophota bacterium]